MECDLKVQIEQDEDGRFVAVCPDLQGCYTEGESEEEARALITDAIQLHVEDRLAPNAHPHRHCEPQRGISR